MLVWTGAVCTSAAHVLLPGAAAEHTRCDAQAEGVSCGILVAEAQALLSTIT